jgi:hypothetical protein
MPAGRRRCGVEGCAHPVHVRGWCTGHYNRWHTIGDVQADRPLGPYRGSRRCEIDGCDDKHKARGMCGPHYDRWYAGQADSEAPATGPNADSGGKSSVEVS